MSILIKGMEMPTSCDKCWALDDYGDYPRCRITEEQRGYNFSIREKRMDKCPLVPVPPHGRLIDGDKLNDYLKTAAIMADGEAKEAYIDARAEANTMPTIILASEEGE